MMYRSNMLNSLVECVGESEERFIDDWDYITTYQTLLMLIEKFNLDDFMEDYHFSEDEYNKYFKKITKVYNRELHKEIKKSFKNKGKRL